MRFASHRDFSRAFERALFRAAIPMAYSSGFNPHPRISYAGAAPTGAASEAEYVEIALAEVVNPQEVRTRLNTTMPPDLVIVASQEAPRGSLAEGLTASEWSARVAESGDLLTELCKNFMQVDEVLVTRMTKRGLREFDARGAVYVLQPQADGLRLVLAHTTPAVRPDDVLGALAQLGDMQWQQTPLFTRVAQGSYQPESATVVDLF
jgi:radical SAM-linked protein